MPQNYITHSGEVHEIRDGCGRIFWQPRKDGLCIWRDRYKVDCRDCDYTSKWYGISDYVDCIKALDKHRIRAVFMKRKKR